LFEAWEEAGVHGAISDQNLGRFQYDKQHPSKPTQRCEVTVYPLRVARLEPKFPERKERRRKWFSARKAAKAVHEPALADLILTASAQLGS
jgi:8-oxo-dGTP pyrophosphatase MutT (NUDIX family)